VKNVPPLATVRITGVAVTFPKRSTADALSCCEYPTPMMTGSVCANRMLAGTSGVAVAANVTGASAPMVADSVCAPLRGPSVHPTLAVPLAFVRADDAATVPAPAVTVNVTVASATPFPNSSFTDTDGDVANTEPTVAVCASPDVFTILAGLAGEATATKLTAGKLPTVAVACCTPVR
jgi:hypothetical protein